LAETPAAALAAAGVVLVASVTRTAGNVTLS
jgi:hypothetical protein